jgi:uncharacterized protein (DUF3084 family)
VEHYYGWLLAIILVLVSGLIAYLGDILGRRLGRRRITIFNLRPRHTAILISVLVGMLITILTLLAAALVSKDVRIGFTKVGEMRRQLSELESQLALSRKSVEKAKARTLSAQEAKAAALTQVGEAEGKLTASQKKLSVTSKELGSVSGRLKQSQKRLIATEKQYFAVEAELKEKTQEVKRGESQAFETSRQLLTLENQMQELARQREGLATEVSALQKQEQSLQGEKQNLEGEVRRLTGLVQVATPALTEETIFEVGHEIGRKVFSPELPIADLRSQLEQFVIELSGTAERAGAGKSEEGKSVIPVRRISEQSKGLVRIYSDPELMEFLARQIHSSENSVVVRASSLLNVPRGKPVLVELSLVQNRLLFKKGEQLGELTVEGKKSEAELLIEIVSWLREKVAQRTREAGILPDISPTGERNLLFGSTRYPVGRVSPERLFELVKAAKKHSGPNKIVARAAEDTWTVGPLQLDLTVAQF